MKLEVMEHEQIFIGLERDITKKQITEEDARDLKRIENKNSKKIFKWGQTYLSPQQWVGVISTSNITIDILPKISETIEHSLVKDILISMLKVAYDIPIRKNVDAMVSYGNHGFLDILAAIFLKELDFQMKNGMIRSYNKQTKNIVNIKGTIDFAKHFNYNCFVENKFFCKYSVLSFDNLLNQTIKGTLLRLDNLVQDNKNKNIIRKLLPYFENVQDITLDNSILNKIVFDRNTYRYKEIIDYCKIFLDGLSIKFESGFVRLELMLFDMNKLFERFIYKSYKSILGNSVVAHYSRNYLLECQSTGKFRANLKPDLLIFNSTDERIIVDTKWKIVNKFSDEKDLYQMNAYLTVIPNVNTGILLYPKSTKNDKIIGEYRIINRDRAIWLKVRTVDLTLLRITTDFFRLLCDILK